VKRILQALAAIILAAGLTLAGSVPAQAASGVNYVTRDCGVGRYPAVKVSNYAGSNVFVESRSTSGALLGKYTVAPYQVTGYFAFSRYNAKQTFRFSGTNYGYSTVCY
jgi:hypothetical protein